MDGQFRFVGSFKAKTERWDSAQVIVNQITNDYELQFLSSAESLTALSPVRLPPESHLRLDLDVLNN